MAKHIQVNMKQLLPIISSLLSLGTLIFALFCLNHLDEGVPTFFFAASILFLSASRFPLAMKAKLYDKKKVPFFKNIVFATVYFALFILILALPKNLYVTCVICGVYFLSIVANRICMCFEKKGLWRIIFNLSIAFLALIMFSFAFAVLKVPETAAALSVSCILVVMVVALYETVTFVLYSIKLRGIWKIIKQTYVLEILYGLAVLLVASSFYFTAMEEEITNFGEGLWFSFSIVTTIGLGDFKIYTFIGRLLCVFLGIYGLIVVAVLTSIIVNYYNEAKAEHVQAELPIDVIEDGKNEDEDPLDK